MDNTKHNRPQPAAVKRQAYEAKLTAYYDKKVVELKKQSNGK